MRSRDDPAATNRNSVPHSITDRFSSQNDAATPITGMPIQRMNIENACTAARTAARSAIRRAEKRLRVTSNAMHSA